MTKIVENRTKKEIEMENNALKKRISELEIDRAERIEKIVKAMEMAHALTQPQDNKKIMMLVSALEESCKDHCPHRADGIACRNCGIAKKASMAGIKMERKEIKENSKEWQ